MASEPQETRFEYASTWLSSRKVLDLQDRYEWKTMRRRSNKPIGSVPAEILVAIFAFLVHRPESRWATPECMLDELDLGMQALIRASQVCRFWRDIILNTSTLWGTFAVGNYPRDRICLQRSRDTPLRVYMPSTNCPFFVELSAHFHRLRELHTEITLPTTSARVSYHLEALYRDSQAPLLECLTVRNRVHHDIFTSNPLKSSFTGQFPGLKRLHTIDLAISLTGQYVITGLTHVKLDGSLVGGVRMDVHDLLEFLQVNPDLKELHLSGALFKQSFECDPQHTPVVPLTGLRKLSMRHFEHSDEIAHILSHLILPPGLAMDLGCSDTNMACGHLLFPPDLSALGNMQRFTHLRIDFTSRYTEFCTAATARRIAKASSLR
ncbi:hypothetical protein NM688_g9423 [Phlebia brevispora]|uniref:Uncharacterized protein n=1 Tax=Phlebia brevispora TaxID=194682 RepID=A0ACC1RHQ8_9APHY|nr:hypothetical protein NM688_g9423 [Phlebia brevispora]